MISITALLICDANSAALSFVTVFTPLEEEFVISLPPPISLPFESTLTVIFTLLPADPPPPPTDVAGAGEEDGNLRVSNISPNKLFCIVVLSTKLLDVEELDVLFIVLLELLDD